MSKNSVKSNYENLLEWLSNRVRTIKPKVTIYKN